MAKPKQALLREELGDRSAKEYLIEGVADGLVDKNAGEKEKALASLYYFSNTVVVAPRIAAGEKNGIAPQPHADICNFLESKRKRLKLLLVPRGALKSTLVHALVLQRIVKFPNIRILYDSENFTNACAHLKEIKDHIETNETFLDLFGNLKGKRWTESEIETSKRNIPRKEATVTAAGVDVVKVGMHYDFIIVDDPHSDKNTTTPEQIQKVVDHYKHLHSILEPGGELIIIGTRWHYNDLYGQLLDDADIRDKFEILVEPAIKNGVSYYPTIHTLADLEEIRELQGSVIFANQYMNSPIDEETALFKRSYMKYWDKEGGKKGWLKQDVAALPPNLIRFTLVDPATPGKTHDFSAIVTVGMSRERQIYVLRAEQGRWEYSELINRIFTAVKEDKPRLVGIENCGFQDLLVKNIAEEKKKRDVWFSTRGLKAGRRSKVNRVGIYGLQPRFESGLVWLRSDMMDLEDQLLRFPNTAHDDLVDALAYSLDVAQFPTTNFFHRERTSYYKPPATPTAY